MRTELIGALIATLALSGCAKSDDHSYADFNKKLRHVYEQDPGSTPFAVIKDGVAGEDWLATIHGYMDNQSVCEQLIAEYNKQPEKSVLPGTYRCKPLKSVDAGG